jgi:ribonuclease HI
LANANKLSVDWGLQDIEVQQKPDYLLWNRGYTVNRLSLIKGAPSDRPTCCYTDGSKLDGQTGWGVHIINKTEMTKYEANGRLNNEASVFQAEIVGILEAAKILIEKKAFSEKRWDFYIDNQGSVLTLDNPEVETKLVAECSETLTTLSKMCEVQLHWIKAHVGHKGNERADVLAKEGTELPDEVINNIPIPKSFVKQKLLEKLTEKWACMWLNERPDEFRQTRFWMSSIDINLSKSLYKLNRPRLSKVIQLITGHNYLGYHQFNIGRINSSKCRYCDFVREDAIHLCTDCPEFRTERERVSNQNGDVRLELKHLIDLVEGPIGELLNPGN